MCGIAGFQGRFEPGLLESMRDALAHRGPDGVGGAQFDEGEGLVTGLGHRRLSIIDLSDEGLQPMTVVCPVCGSQGLRDLALTYNGEVYNYRELRRELEAQGHVFHSATDSEVVLHLYAVHGPAMLERLNGIFAFALRDGRATGRPAGVRQGELLIARDPLGVKPLYFAELPAGFLFGSEIKALAQCELLPREIDHVALHQTLAYLWTPAPRTMLRAVRKLEPGHALRVRLGRVAANTRYYELPYGQGSFGGTEDDAAAAVRESIRAATERQLVADVPVGAFLSGGLDSSSVVAMMRAARPDERLVCYSIGFGDEPDAEGNPPDLPFARRVAAQFGIELREIRVTPDIIQHLERMLWHLDEPQADPAPINSLLICEQAHADGFKVLLSGAGGDDIFSGYRRHRALQYDAVWERLPAGVRRFAAGPVRRTLPQSGWGRRAAKLLEFACLNGDERLVSYFWWSGEGQRRGLYAPALAAELRDADTAEPLLASLRSIKGERDPLHRMLYLEARHFLADHNLNYTDKTGMASGIEVRVPLLDLEVVKLAASLPSHWKQKGASGKAILKRAMASVLPHDVIHRGKTGFGAPVRRWLRQELRDRVEETLSAATLARRGLFDPAAVRRLIDDDRAGRVDGAYTVFVLMCIELWCRMFVDAPVTRARAPAPARAPAARIA